MNIMFLSADSQLVVPYAARLEKNNLPFWIADNCNDFHRLMSQLSIDLVLSDYNFMNFSDFNVYRHIRKFRDDLAFLFLNDPNQSVGLFIQWEDQITQNQPKLWTKDFETVLRIVANQPPVVETIPKPACVRDLLTQIEQNIEQNTETESRKDSVMLHGVSASPTSAREPEPLEEFWSLRRLFNLSYGEYLLLELLRRRRNGLVSLSDMIRVLEIPHDEKSVKKIYRYIHRLRLFLQEWGQGEGRLVRIKKGHYSLISFSQNDVH